MLFSHLGNAYSILSNSVYYTKRTVFEYIERRLFKKRLMRTKVDIYVLLLSLGRYLDWWTISPQRYHPLSSRCFYHWVDTSAGELLVPKGITRSVVSVSSLTWLIRYIYYWNLQFLSNLIIIKTKDSFPSGIVADFGYPVWAHWSYWSQTL